MPKTMPQKGNLISQTFQINFIMLKTTTCPRLQQVQVYNIPKTKTSQRLPHVQDYNVFKTSTC